MKGGLYQPVKTKLGAQSFSINDDTTTGTLRINLVLAGVLDNPFILCKLSCNKYLGPVSAKCYRLLGVTSRVTLLLSKFDINHVR